MAEFSMILAMNITTRHKRNTAIIGIEADMMGGELSELLHDAIKENVSRGERNLILELKKVKRINSIGVGEIIAAWTTLQNAGGRFALLHLSDKVAEILSICEIDQFIPIFTDERQAISALQAKKTPF